MSFKQTLKMKLPFTRKGLEDYLDEQLALMRCQQADEMQRMVSERLDALAVQLTEELNVQLHRCINDLQSSMIEQLSQELNAQLHRRINDLDSAITFQTEALTAKFAEELNAQLHRRVNDLQSSMIGQLSQELNTQLHRRTNDLDSAITLQTEALTAKFAEELNAQLHRRVNDLQSSVIRQLSQELNMQLHRRTNDLDRGITGVRNELYGFFRRFPKTMLSFEVALAEHCNLNCVGCSHFSPLAPPSFVDLEEFTRDFTQMAHMFGDRTQQVKLLGGEPLLNRDINKYLLVARECFPQSEIMIITNGLLLPQMDASFWKVCKENQIVIAPTRYPVNFDYDEAEKLVKEHDVQYRCFADREATKVFGKYPLDLQGLQDCEGNYRMCFVANSCIYLQHGRLYTCPIAPTAHYMNEVFGTQMLESPDDSIDIYQAKSAQEILEFLAKPIPFCRYCRRDIVIDDIPWSHSKRELSEWTL